MGNIIDILLILTACLIIVLVLVQGGNAKGANILSGNNSELNLFSKKKTFGAQNVVKKATLITGIVFFLLIALGRHM